MGVAYIYGEHGPLLLVGVAYIAGPLLLVGVTYMYMYMYIIYMHVHVHVHVALLLVGMFSLSGCGLYNIYTCSFGGCGLSY